MREDNTGELAGRTRLFGDAAGAAVVETVISSGIEVKGKLRGRSNLDVRGTVDGTASLEGRLRIGPGGKFIGDIEATEVIVEGRVEGTIRAHQRVELRSGCTVEGNIQALKVAIAAGCEFRGQVLMASSTGRAEAAVPRPLAAAAAT